MRPRRGYDRPPEEPRTRINEAIRVPQVRLIGADGEQIGVKDRDDALEFAWNQNLDLVEVAAAADPPDEPPGTRVRSQGFLTDPK